MAQSVGESPPSPWMEMAWTTIFSWPIWGFFCTQPKNRTLSLGWRSLFSFLNWPPILAAWFRPVSLKRQKWYLLNNWTKSSISWTEVKVYSFSKKTCVHWKDVLKQDPSTVTGTQRQMWPPSVLPVLQISDHDFSSTQIRMICVEVPRGPGNTPHWGHQCWWLDPAVSWGWPDIQRSPMTKKAEVWHCKQRG